MEGTVWAGLMCTITMDKLGKEVYADPALVYKYRGKVQVPPLEQTCKKSQNFRKWIF